MRENEAAAHSVVRQLAELGISATAAGSGLHWRVEVAAVAGRAVRAPLLLVRVGDHWPDARHEPG